MEFSPSSTDLEKNNPKRPIPPEVFQAVRVMGQGARPVASVSVQKTPHSKNASRPSPFLDGAPAAPPSRSGSFSPAPLKKEAPFEKNILLKEQIRQKPVLIGACALAILLLLGGVWYWYVSRKSAVETIENPAEEAPSVIMQSSVELSAEPFSPETTNFLSFDTETITPEGLRQLFSEAGNKIVTANMTKPVEFLLTDKNNNPVAFNRFAYLMALGLPDDLVAALGEHFSVFLYNDQGKVVIGLAFVPENMSVVQEMVKEQEADLPFLFRSLLFNGINVSKKSSFRSGTYNNEAVRYVNINEADNMSFDYVLKEKEWIIGGSKNTLRAILDKKVN